jgi:hypothetical protein
MVSLDLNSVKSSDSVIFTFTPNGFNGRKFVPWQDMLELIKFHFGIFNHNDSVQIRFSSSDHLVFYRGFIIVLMNILLVAGKLYKIYCAFRRGVLVFIK